MDKSCVYYYKNEWGIEYVYCKESKLSYSEHSHVSTYTIVLPLSGELLLKREDKDYKVKPSRYFIIRPYEAHSISLKSKSYNMISVCINQKLTEPCNLEKLELIISKDLEHLVRNNIINYEQGILLINAVQELSAEDKSKNMEENINSLACYIVNNPEVKLNINSMAEKINISKYHFIRQFKREVGLTPHKFQIQNRIRKAKHILNSNYSIVEVALLTGFYDESHFIRHFKNIMRITPMEYKTSYIKLQ